MPFEADPVRLTKKQRSELNEIACAVSLPAGFVLRARIILLLADGFSYDAIMDEVVADLVICTHEHLDHMDTNALPVLVRDPRTHFAGPVVCWQTFRDIGVPENRCHLLEEGKHITAAGVSVLGVYADHGEYAPDALGVVVDFPSVRVYHTGDTAYRPVEFGPAIALKPDILLPCINGRFGNMNAKEAAQLTQSIGPQLVIPCHFWMFVVHNGDPGLFLQECAELAPRVQSVIPKPGEEILFRKEDSAERAGGKA